MNTEIAAYSPTKAALVDLAAKYKGLIFEVTTPKGMAEAKAAYADINQHSITLERARKKEKVAAKESALRDAINSVAKITLKAVA